MTKTVEDVHEWLAAEAIEEDLEGTNEENVLKATEPNVPASIWKFMTSHEKGLNTLRAGGWLMYHLQGGELGLPEEEASRIGFQHGRVSLYQDPFEAAVSLFNLAAEEWI